jgi:ATP-dependent helicase HrpB
VGEYRLASGRGAFVEATDALARHPFLAVAELAGGGARDRILLAAPLEQVELERLFAADITTEIEAIARPDGKVQVKEIRRLGELVLGERLVERPAPELLQRALLDRLRREGLGGLNWGEGAESFRARLAFMRGLEGEAWPDLSDAALIAQLDDWLTPLLRGKANLADLNPGDLDHALRALVLWDVQRKLDEAAPARFTAPTGTSCAIDYATEAGPTVEIRVQELYGQSVHPTVGQERIPLILALLSPARRPVQVTRDLPGFWKGSWKDVRTEMKGRYPKHPWPEDPASAAPTTRAKPRGT